MKIGQYILALDQGTTSSRAIVFNSYGEIVSEGQKADSPHALRLLNQGYGFLFYPVQMS